VGAARRSGIERRWSGHGGHRGRGPRPALWEEKEKGEVGIKEGGKRRGLAAHRAEERQPRLSGKSGRGATILVFEAGGPSHGRTGEVVACLSSGERERSGKGERDGDRHF
jgi:hypothetical protein